MKNVILKTVISSMMAVSLLGTSVAYGATTATKATSNASSNTSNAKKDGAKDLNSYLKDGKIAILLLGIDGPTDVGQRSDSVMMAQIDTVKNDIKIISMPRDSYVDIPGEGEDKLTHAFAYGGADLTLETLTKNFDIPLAGFMTLNFTTFPQFIDKIGGVEIELSAEEAQIAIGKAEAGTVTLTGKQALAYGRIRKIDSDYMRTGRHRKLMVAIISKIKAMDKKELPELATSLYSVINSNIPMEVLLELGNKAIENNYEVKHTLIPTEENSWGDYTSGGAWILGFDREKAKKDMHDFLNK